MHFVLCSRKIEKSERKKIARKQRYSSFEYCEMEPLKKKPLVTSRKENRHIGVQIFALNSRKINFFFSVQSSFDQKQCVCKTYQLIQTFSINRV